MRGIELFDKIIKLEKLAANVMKQILSAVLFFDKNQILHRDLKPQNILIDFTENSKNQDEFCCVIVIDFGTAEILKKDTLLSNNIGKSYYIAPEVLNNLCNKKWDLWSCSVIIYIMLLGCPAFYGKITWKFVPLLKAESLFSGTKYRKVFHNMRKV